MSFDLYENNDQLLEAVNGVITKDELTDTRWLSEEELVEHYDNTQAKNTSDNVEVPYSTVINYLVKEINEATDTKMKNTLETLAYILLKEHEETEIVPTAIVERINKISSRELIKENNAVELTESKLKKGQKLYIPLAMNGKIFQDGGPQMAEDIFGAIEDNMSWDTEVTIEDVSYDGKMNAIVVDMLMPQEYDSKEVLKLGQKIADWDAERNYDTYILAPKKMFIK